MVSKGSLSVLFLGAGRLLQLLDYFKARAAVAGYSVSLTSVELEPYCAIRSVADIVVGPRFTAPGAGKFLIDLLGQRDFDIVVPNMDSATVLLSSVVGQVRAHGAFPLVSSEALCRAMNDKLAADEVFRGWGVARPLLATRAPCIAKHRYGYGSRGIYKFYNEVDLKLFRTRPDFADFIVQDLIEGPEYSVDAYVDRNGRLVDALIRRRLHVEAGIVVDSITCHNERVKAATEQVVASANGEWFGPLTLQFMEDDAGVHLIEVNPRFGGGVTHALGCGLDMVGWMISDLRGETIEHEPFAWPEGHRMTRARMDVYHSPLDGYARAERALRP